MRTGRRSLGAAVLALAALAPACGRGGPEPPRPVPGIVLVCLDTLRGDALAASGGTGRAMPAFEAFAKGATAFADASACASWTAPAVTSLLTGLLPSKHGVQGVHEARPLVASVPTLAETLRAAGWWTGAWTAGGWVSDAQGLARGFDAFEPTFDSAGGKASVEAFARARPAGKPFFLFLHTYAAHDPYGDKAPVGPEVPDDLRREAERLGAAADRGGGVLPLEDVGTLMSAYLSDARARTVFGKVMEQRDHTKLWAQCMEWVDGAYVGAPNRARTEALLRDAYWDGVAYADRVLAATLGALDAAGLPAGTAVVVVSDHGEAFGEHGYLGHGRYLHEELIRIPLVVRAPGRFPAGTVVRGSCSLLDVAPTLLDLAGVAPPAPLDGRGLLPLARGEARGRPVVAEADPDGTRGGVRTPARAVAVRGDRWKGLLTFDPRDGRVRSEEHFDLRAPGGDATPVPAPKADPGLPADDALAAFLAAWADTRRAVERLGR